MGFRHDEFVSRVQSVTVGQSSGLVTDTDSKEIPMAINVEPALSPHLVVGDAAAAIDFYVKAFGAEEIGRVPRPDGKLVHAAVRINGFLVMLNDDFPEMCGGKSMTPTSLGAPGDDPLDGHRCRGQVPAGRGRGRHRGDPVGRPVLGDRYGMVADPFGHQWSLGQPIREVSIEEIQSAMAAQASG